MIEALLLFCLVALVIGPPVIIALVPFPYWRPVAGWVLLVAGLVWLDERNIPFQDQGMLAGAGGGWAKFIAVTTLFAVGFNVARNASYLKRAAPPWLADWQPPMAILAAVFFFHWLANRLAGWTPAANAHLVAAGACLAVISILAVALRYRRWRVEPRPFMLGFSGILLVLVARAGLTAQSNFDLALKEADGRNFCLLTFSGRDRARQATRIFELSPLVSRSGGRNYADDAVWLFIGDLPPAPSAQPSDWKRDGTTIYRDTIIVEPRDDSGSNKPLPCRATPDGGIVGL